MKNGVRRALIAFVLALMFASAVLAGTWSPLGPGNIGGRTRALLIHPSDPTIMYAAGVSGGIWKTTDGGASWVPQNDAMASLVVTTLAMNPADANVIYAGGGAGIFKTIDGGITWASLPSTNSASFYPVNDIVVSQLNSQRVYSATRFGIWRSTDSGTNWSQVLYSDGDSVVTPDGCQGLVIRTDQATNDYVLAACGGSIGGRVFRSTSAQTCNSSSCWDQLSLGVGAGDLGVISLAIAPSNQNVVYAMAAKNLPGSVWHASLYAVFRSTNSGDSWTTQRLNDENASELNNLLLSNPYNALCLVGKITNVGNFANVIAADPVNPDRLWAGGVDLYRSDDAGVTWGLASHSTATPGSPSNYMHEDQQAIAFANGYDGASNTTMFLTNDGGIFRTDDALAAVATGSTAPCDESTSVPWTELNNNYAVTQFHYGLPYPDGVTYFGGTQDQGTIRGNDTDGPEAWNQILEGDSGGYVAIDPTNTDVLYAENSGISIQKSTDGGATFQPATNGIPSTEKGVSVSPFVMDPSEPQRLWTGGVALWRTNDGAQTWTKASDGSGNGQVVAIAVAPSNPNHVLAGKTNGTIIRTNVGLTSSGATRWSSVLPVAGYVSSVAFDPTNDNIAYATYSTVSQGAKAHVWKSADGGANWSGIDGTGLNKIPDVAVHSIIVDPTNSSVLYVGTDKGVYASSDGGTNWAVKGAGLPNVITKALSLINVGGSQTLFAFTYGRGAWRLDIGPPPVPPVVSITEPAAGTVSGTIQVSATANDDTGVSKVEFYVDSALISTDFTDPYDIQWDTTTVGNGNHDLTARAYDLDDAVGVSTPVSISVDNPITALFEDDFNDDQVPPWTQTKGTWTESNGNLQTTTLSKNIIDGPAGTACGACQISNDLTLITGGATVWIYGWYKDSNNYIRVELSDKKNKVTFLQKANGSTVLKRAVDTILDANQMYNLAVAFASGKFQLYLNGAQLITDLATAQTPSSLGKVTYTVKAAVVNSVKVSTTVYFHHIIITP